MTGPTGSGKSATLLTSGALGRLRDMGVESFLLACSLLGVLSQRLFGTLCSHCRRPVVPTRELLQQAGLTPLLPPPYATRHNAPAVAEVLRHWAGLVTAGGTQYCTAAAMASLVITGVKQRVVLGGCTGR
ncbi:hypothetical protein C1166_24150 [Enterobacter bugandensis]|uniref:Bacterial type II secretion system protein E domain-containing protein n=1 Tax=Enterobacter bugandensis TaxID=881260 RepID=A0ABX4VGC0_9ENTR|nr:hypothetical protein C1166_24150 [Enterobacter bugandensis]PNF51337.1 hypothetical protein C1169_24160 [Enterobacter bugandensis]PNF61745.1 hypothetical protein C1168_24160 [Enterobacter bugandensis]PNF66383.1 hypothetical protein C1167_24160 [Enterobacter bugandensis]RKN87181.1 hypothetical protein D8O00_23995 [Enterobacter bugandensis]